MFGELSHELKNILFGAGLQVTLEKDDVLLTASVLNFQEDARKIFVEGLLSPFFEGNLRDNLQNLPLPEADSLQRMRRQVRLLIAEMSISPEDQKLLWQAILDLPQEELHFSSIQLKLFMQNKQLLHTITRCRDFTQSILTFSREERAQQHALISSCWHQVQTMVNARLRKNSIQTKGHLPDCMVLISPSELMQVFLNMMTNAIDAIEDLVGDQKWIQVESQIESGKLIISFSNGGEPIPSDICRRIFDRGFSTKGQRGNGLGLYLARRILTQSGGELIYNERTPHPQFELTFRLVSEIAIKDSIPA
jgi:signal transduction histidine kinase